MSDSVPLPRCIGRRRLAARRGLTARGFTLTELTVSLTAGLIVATGLVGLSHEATNSFHEEVRVAAAESGSRTAIDRLRADLQRASFMSTANIQRDPNIAVAPGQPNVILSEASAYPGLAKLAGIRLVVGGSQLNTPLSTVQIPRALNPDQIYIAGNMTSTDQFVVRNIAPPGGTCQRIWLAVDSPAMWRILATEFSTGEGGATTGNAADQALANAFQPGRIIGNGNGNPYMIRFVDQTGRAQYAVTCAPATGGASQPAPDPWVDIDSRWPILTTRNTQTQGGAGGFGVGTTINPISMVKWEITSTLPAAVAAQMPSGDPNNYYLTRSFVDIASASLGPVAGTTEVISEYAVDLKFAFTADSSQLVGASAGTAPTPTLIAFDNDATNAAWGLDVSGLTALPAPPQGAATGPQRIRSVRVRLVTRAGVADRTTNIQPAPANQPNQNFVYRYCSGPGGAEAGIPDCTVQNAQIWSRARTVVTEVSLPNQQRLFWL